MADVSLDDYILQSGFTQRANKGYSEAPHVHFSISKTSFSIGLFALA